jgi:predicted kinase
MVGIPASGKTTWIEGNLPTSVVRIRLDRIRRRTYGYDLFQLEASKEEKVWSRADLLLSKAIRAGHDVVVDSMALTNEWRQRILRVADEASRTPLEKVAIFLDTPVDLALSRNQNREKHVPDDAVREMKGHVRRPSKEEGFSKIVIVRPDKILSRASRERLTGKQSEEDARVCTESRN